MTAKSPNSEENIEQNKHKRISTLHHCASPSTISTNSEMKHCQMDSI